VALTYTIAGLRAELDALETARKARNWALAWDEFGDYVSVYAALAAKGSLGDKSYEFPEPEALRKGLEMTQAIIARTTEASRLVRTRVAYRDP